MLISQAFRFTLKGAPADMRVVRNNGYCWGRIVFPDRRRAQLDVSSRFDLYWRADDYAAEVFIRKALRGGTEPIAGSPI